MEEQTKQEKIIKLAKKVRENQSQFLEKMTEEQLKNQILQNNIDAKEFAIQNDIKVEKVKSGNKNE